MTPKPDNAANNSQPGTGPASDRDVERPEKRPAKNDEDVRHPAKNDEDVRQKTLDKTLADSFPTSDPPSSIPDPSEDENAA